VIDILDDMSGYQIPTGAAAIAAIHTEDWHHVSVMRKILLRMQSWMNYIYLEGQRSRKTKDESVVEAEIRNIPQNECAP
jgi:hypothetical protein